MTDPNYKLDLRQGRLATQAAITAHLHGDNHEAIRIIRELVNRDSAAATFAAIWSAVQVVGMLPTDTDLISDFFTSVELDGL